jgi:2-dehydropantoate 2-reductase
LLAETAGINDKMTTVAIIGCGALGLNYGTRLLEAQIYHNEDLDVSLVLRRDFDLVQAEGIAVEYGKATESKRRLEFSAAQLAGKIFRSTSELAYSKGRMDWVIVCCKSYSIDDALRDSLLPLVGDTTKVLVIMNGLGVEKCFIDWFGAERVYGGLSLIACNRGPNPPLSPGPLVVNVYLDLKLEISHVTDNVEKTKLAIDLFKRTALRDTVSLSTNLLRARWDKLTWNLTYAGISVAMGGLTCDVIVRDPSLRLLANNVICDTIRVANADVRRQHQERHGEGAEVPAADLLSQETILGK